MHSHRKKKNSTNQLVNTTTAMDPAKRSIVRRLVATSATTANTVFTRGTTDVTATSQWSAFAATYAECRVLAITIRQSGTGPSSSNQSGFAVFGTDRSGTSSASSLAGVWSMQSPKAFNAISTALQPMSYTARAIDLEDQLFAPTGAVPNNFGIFGINPFAAPLLIEYLVEFKGSL